MSDRPAERHAVIISVAGYEEDSGLIGYESIDESARRLRELFAEHGEGLWSSVVRVAEPRTPHEIMDAVAEGMRAARGGGQLLVYYIGHGEPYRGIQLALSTSRDRTPWSFLALDHVKAEMRRYHDCSRALVLDCCYCAEAGALGAPSVQAGVADAGRGASAARQGAEPWFGREPDTCVLTAVSPTSPSPLTGAWRSDGLTDFSGLLIDLLESGIPGAGPLLTVRDVYQAMGERADTRKLRPDLISRGASTPAIFPNRAAPGDGRHDGLRDARSRERRLAAAGVEELVAAWVRRHGPLADIEAERIAAAVARRMAEAAADQVTRLVHSAHTYEEGNQEWLFDALSVPLLGRDARDSGAVLAALDAQECPECREFARRIGRSIVERGGAETLRRLMLGRTRSVPPPRPAAGESP